MALGVQRVEGVKELFLSAFPAGQEVHVIENQHVDLPHPFLEPAHAIVPERGNKVIHEQFRGGEDNLASPIGSGKLMTYGRNEVSLAPDTAIEEKRVVFFTRLVGNGNRGGVGELITLADHEFVKRITRVKVATPAWVRIVGLAARGWWRNPHLADPVLLAVLLSCYQRDFKVCPGFGRDTLAEVVKVAVIDPIAKEFVGCLKGSGVALNSDEAQRRNPGLKPHLTQTFTQPAAHPAKMSPCASFPPFFGRI